MKSTDKKISSDAWLSKRDMCRVLDVGQAHFDSTVRRFARPEHVKRVGRRLLFYSRGLLDSWYCRKLGVESVQRGTEGDLAMVYDQLDSLGLIQSGESGDA